MVTSTDECGSSVPGLSPSEGGGVLRLLAPAGEVLVSRRGHSSYLTLAGFHIAGGLAPRRSLISPEPWRR